MPSNPLPDVIRNFQPSPQKTGRYYSLPALEQAGLGAISRLPVSLRVVLESLLRNCDGQRVSEADVRNLASWQPNAPRTAEVPFVVSRVLLQDFTGVPLLVDLAAMRSAATRLGADPGRIEPEVPVELVIDHSVQVDFAGRDDALSLNLAIEMQRNRQRYEFLKWGMQAFDSLRIVPPGVGICHQVNLESLARGVMRPKGEVDGGVYYFDSLVGTDSHTTMVNGLGVVGWGVGGIEAEAAMLGQPVYLLMPDVVGVHLVGALQPGVTATDLVLRVTQLLRQTQVVGKFVEFFGDAVAALSVPDRATIGNMSPEYGATIGYFPPDEQSCRYLAATGRSDEHVAAFRSYLQAQGMFGAPRPGQCDYSQVVELDLSTVEPSVAGPRRPQDRIALGELRQSFRALLAAPAPKGFGRSEQERSARHPVELGDHECGPHDVTHIVGGGSQDTATMPNPRTATTSLLTESEMINNRPTPDRLGWHICDKPKTVHDAIADGDVLIAAITSCTNTSNPSVMLAAGLVAKKAVERGLRVRPTVKTSLAPGSRVVSDYLERTGLQPFLDAIGFQTVGYGCTTCIGNSGPLHPAVEEVLQQHGVVGASVLSGNRNFEARIHQSIKANFLMSPPLVVAFALAGRVDIDLQREPLGRDKDGREVYLRELWPTPAEVSSLLASASDPEVYRRLYGDVADQNPLWSSIPSPTGRDYAWDPASTYVREPPYFDGFTLDDPNGGDGHVQAPTTFTLEGARALALFGDSITTDHISPAGAIQPSSPAGAYLRTHCVLPQDFNSYGSRRGNHEVMVRGTFANVRIKNLLVPGVEGGVTVHQPSGERLSIYDAAMRYQGEGVPLIVVAGQDYGAGSSRDWAAKGTQLLGVRAVVARSFERIHRSNLVGMGVLPCQLPEGASAESLKLDGSEQFDLVGSGPVAPRMLAALRIRRQGGAVDEVPVTVRIDTPIEVEYFRRGGILPYVLAGLLAKS